MYIYTFIYIHTFIQIYKTYLTQMPPLLPLSSTRYFPSHFHVLFLKNNLINQCYLHAHGCRATYPPTLEKSNPSIVISYQQLLSNGQNLMCPFPILTFSYASNHSCCKFMSTTAMPYQEDRLSQHVFPFLFLIFFLSIPWFLQGCPVQG